ncbi:phosphatidylinositol 4-phosphate 5-kinase 1 isoform X2 [Elaeis guineensis]|uniref:Phosphatidylinositol 4-phosphate 5-kinase n=1 Tax=Elaeis guineensis var. tenera TaxID=51953 RepID=A0A8N4EXB7_ELAGV|nr:phosphatidylinositol 4-phosphate 5-kinase 1 isoform X2 [Elaeis guineensis]XP_029119305.1 phosphatidylinositol 4-phosphate 5-kinase 1 isoform X2 [Elaeis guineensis]
MNNHASRQDRHCEEVLANGDVYVGNLDGLLPHGTGKYIWSDGTLYEGEWEKSKMTGRGRIYWPAGATYEGDICGGFLHGSGTFYGPGGSVYKGSWRMNIQHGMGTKTYPNSDIYEGLWREGLQEGIGRYTWSSGNTYIGNWKAGKMNGRGVMKWANGDLFDGVWLDGLEHGSGYYKYADGAYYFGTWSRGLKDGRGTFYPAGSKLPKQKFSESVVCNDGAQSLCTASLMSSEGLRNKPLHKKRYSLDGWNISSYFCHSGRISHRPTSFDGIWNFGDSACSVLSQDSSLTLSSSSDDGPHKLQHDNVLVYEREYVQGVLIMERARSSDSGVKHTKKCHHKIRRKQPRGPGEAIHKGHKSYYLMLNLQLGIRYTVGKITPVPMREVRSSDFGPRARIRMYFPSKGSQFTPPHHSIDFFWKDYCPMVFRNLREMFKIDAADYMMSICGVDGLKELSSPGKSGSIFYLSQDERFVIKTLRKYELKILLKMLPKYYNHVGIYDNTLITKFFGLHRITIKGARKVRFVVMGNMFCTELRIHRRYDLKGSSQGRSTSKHNINENTTLKDLDLSYVFHLENSWRESLFRQISLDCMFLESQCIIDYSMLLGLHFRAPEHLKALLESQHTLQNSSSSQANNSDEPSQDEVTVPPKGLLLVAHEPGSVNTMPGSHIRGSTLRASAVGDEEVDLILPGTGRLRVQLGVNMPAQAQRKLLHNEGPDSAEIDPVEVYDVVLYLGIIDILQEYNMTKKIEHAYKSLKFDPLSISAVEPKLYSKRFISFLEKVFRQEI